MSGSLKDLTLTPERGNAAALPKGPPPCPVISTFPGLPELLAPAGDWECARAAVENGADAIYFGLEKFNARMRAQNFTEADLPSLMDFLHERGVKGYVTFNTLVFENEMADAERFASALITGGVDAAIVQDVGICRLIRRLSPDFPIHVSTQMTVTSAAGVDFARELGCDLVVLARECSLVEIGKIQQAQAELAKSGHARTLPLEVFVHGALCVAYSGQCLTSEALGGRSANRGECAQACRMPYELISDGQPVPLGDRKYLLSPQDLAGLELLPELAKLGIASLKIEGRLKSPEYVANITRIYRDALDKISIAPGDAALQRTESRTEPSHQPQYEMEMAFSRGLYTGWFRGINNQQLVHARFGKKRGVFLGEVLEVRNEAVIIRLASPLKRGDGVVFDAGKPEEKEEGGRVYDILPQKRAGSPAGACVLRFGAGDVDFRRVHTGDRLWKTSDPELERRLRRSFEGAGPKFQRPLFIEAHGVAGRPLTLIARDESGHVVRVESAMPLVHAQNQPLTSARLTEQLGRLGGTPFRLGNLQNRLEGDLLLPLSELNRLRRQMVTDLHELRARPNRWTLNQLPRSEVEPSCPSNSHPLARTQNAAPTPQAANLAVLVRDVSQLEAALSTGVNRLYCDFEDPKKYRDAVREVRSSTSAPTERVIFVAPPRIFKMGEDWILNQVRSCEPDGYLVRNYDHLRFFAGSPCIGDYSLNVANRLAAEYFKNHFGLERLTASYDLNFTQLEALLQSAPPEWFEVTLHQHMPMFHMEHCVFCAFLSQGTNYTNCGRPCDRHQLKLRDRVGAEHPVKADLGCRNTVFNALAQTGAEYFTRMMDLGVRSYRLEFLTESPQQVVSTIHKYSSLLRGELSGSQLWRDLKLFNQLGVTRGQIAGSAMRS